MGTFQHRWIMSKFPSLCVLLSAKGVWEIEYPGAEMFKGVNNQKRKEGSRHSKDFSFKHTYKTRLTDFLDFFSTTKNGKKNIITK